MVNGSRHAKSTAKAKWLEFSLPELQSNRKIKKLFHIVNIDIKHDDMSIDRNLITSLQLDIKGSTLSIEWDDAIILHGETPNQQSNIST